MSFSHLDRDNYLDVIRQEADRLVGRPYTVDLLGEMAEDADDNDPNDRLKTQKSKPSNRVAGLLSKVILAQTQKIHLTTLLLEVVANLLMQRVLRCPTHLPMHTTLFLYGETGLGKRTSYMLSLIRHLTAIAAELPMCPVKILPMNSFVRFGRTRLQNFVPDTEASTTY